MQGPVFDFNEYKKEYLERVKTQAVGPSRHDHDRIEAEFLKYSESHNDIRDSEYLSTLHQLNIRALQSDGVPFADPLPGEAPYVFATKLEKGAILFRGTKDPSDIYGGINIPVARALNIDTTYRTTWFSGLGVASGFGAYVKAYRLEQDIMLFDLDKCSTSLAVQGAVTNWLQTPSGRSKVTAPMNYDRTELIYSGGADGGTPRTRDQAIESFKRAMPVRIETQAHSNEAAINAASDRFYAMDFKRSPSDIAAEMAAIYASIGETAESIPKKVENNDAAERDAKERFFAIDFTRTEREIIADTDAIFASIGESSEDAIPRLVKTLFQRAFTTDCTPDSKYYRQYGRPISGRANATFRHDFGVIRLICLMMEDSRNTANIRGWSSLQQDDDHSNLVTGRMAANFSGDIEIVLCGDGLLTPLGTYKKEAGTSAGVYWDIFTGRPMSWCNNCPEGERCADDAKLNVRCETSFAERGLGRSKRQAEEQPEWEEERAKLKRLE
jgi:hypothetical protein